MSTPASTSEAPLPQSQGVARAAVITTHPFHWALKRELWEHKALYIAPLVVTGMVLLGVMLNFTLHGGMRLLTVLEPQRQRAMLSATYGGIAALMFTVMAIVGWFYCLDALYSERRDRSLLFWKSLPVSDLTTVLAKLAVPGVAIPVITFVFVVATQLVLLILSTIAGLIGGYNPAPLWTQLPLIQMTLVLAHALVVVALWYAPVYGWLLLVSSWARRSTFLWAIMPPLAVCVLERMAFGSNHFLALLGHRMTGVTAHVGRGGAGSSFDDRLAQSAEPWSGQVAQLFEPMRFLSDPGLWAGLVVAAAFVAAAVWMRRYREPF